MNQKRTAIFAALLAGSVATGAMAQSASPGAQPTKPAATTTPPASTAKPATPGSGSTGMDKGAGTGAAAAPGSMAKSGAASALPRSERRFVENALQDGMEEVELSKLAMDKAQSAQVKELAKRIVDDHTKVNAELSKIASSKGVTPPAAVDASHRRKMERMAKKTGADFDRDYLDDMIDDHQKDVREFRSMSKSAKDADIKAFATSTLPALEQHLQMAKSTEAAMKKGGRDRTMTSATPGSKATGTTGGGPTGTAKSTATPGKDTAATTGTAGPGTGMPTSSATATGSSPQPPGSASDASRLGTPKK